MTDEIPDTIQTTRERAMGTLPKGATVDERIRNGAAVANAAAGNDTILPRLGDWLRNSD